jgi:heme-degrading monooxygenase HmoA
MIVEVADIHIQPGRQAAFDEAIERGLRIVIARQKGFRGFRVHKGIESPERYLLMIDWDTVADHTIGFRQSPAFAEWRALVGPFFAQPPVVEHFTVSARSEHSE